MIEFQKINEKGDKITAYTHKNFLSKHYNEEIVKAEIGNKKVAATSFWATGILTYFATTQVPAIHSFVQNKLSFKARHLIVSGTVGLFTSLFVSLICSKSLKSTHENLLKHQTFPIWYRKDKVINPDRVFFELDDQKHQQINIYHSGITHSTIQNLVPDAIFGTPVKPHAPSADHHAHH